MQKTSISPYHDYRKSSDIHGTALYPAVMVAPMQREIIGEYIGDQKVVSICDPFIGSGTSLYEALQLDSEAKLIGSDINPLAILISRVKLEGVDGDEILGDMESIKQRLISSVDDVEPIRFHNIDKWFKPEIAQSLSEINKAVNEVENQKNRRYFWYMLIDIVRKYCNSRSSTYKLHERPQTQIDNIKNSVIEDYLKKINYELKYFQRNCTADIVLNQGDSIDFLKSYEDESIDICVSSPPYGDNATTVPYGQYSSLAMSWINPEDLNLEGWELDNYAAIDSRSLGGCKHETSIDANIEIEDVNIKDQIAGIEENKQTKVIRFMRSYQVFLSEVSRVTKGPIILTLGDRTVDGVRIDLTGFTKRYFEEHGRCVEERMRRAIRNKRTPSNVSNVHGKSVSSMKEELVIIAE